jgi:CubicO group peptidase (beta-lactamase class C family)
MTKPVTSVAAMMLVERGLLGLDDPVSAYIPEFADMRVYDGGSPGSVRTRPAAHPVTVGQLLTHTAGLPTWTRWTRCTAGLAMTYSRYRARHLSRCAPK